MKWKIHKECTKEDIEPCPLFSCIKTRKEWNNMEETKKMVKGEENGGIF